MILYIAAAIVVGFIVPSNNPNLSSSSNSFSDPAHSSPWIVAMNIAGYSAGPRILISLFVLSAFSSSSAELYVASRYFFFLSRRGHAPWVFGSLYKSKSLRRDVLPQAVYPSRTPSTPLPLYSKEENTSPNVKSDFEGVNKRPSSSQSKVESFNPPLVGRTVTIASEPFSPTATIAPLRRRRTFVLTPPPKIVVPWVGTCFAAGLSIIVFMRPSRNAGVANTYSFFTSMTNCACLISWICMLYTYLRFYKGTKYAEQTQSGFVDTNRDSIYRNRAWGQPWLARYALWCSVIILLGQGWAVFTDSGVAHIAEMVDEQGIIQNPDIGDFDRTFITSYLPVPMFLLLTFGYKLVYQTAFVPVTEMDFSRRVWTQPIPEPPATTFVEKIYRILL